MHYTLDKLIKVLRLRLQDEEYSKELLTQFINDSQNEILGEDKYPFMQKIDNYVADESGEVNLPLGYDTTLFLFANKEGQPRARLQYVAPQDFFDHTDAHTLCYTSYGGKLFYRIFKDSDNQGFNLEHLFLIKPLPLEKDTDKTPIPNEFVEALILGALARAEETRDNFDYAIIYQNKQDTLLTNMKLRYGPGNLSAGNTARLPYHFGGYYDRH